ncbi:MAG: hypothetical protein JNM67_12635 [Bacteroidetes bacterium]|nr:hypothetical protein [Bacteroidota bacterium]
MDRKTQILSLLKDNSTDIFLQYALAMEYMSENKTSEAIDVLVAIRNQDPDYLPLYYQLAKLYEAAEQNNLAIKTYEEGMVVAQKSNDKKTLAELRSALEELTF